MQSEIISEIYRGLDGRMRVEDVRMNSSALAQSSEDWRRRALTSLAVGNGAGLIGFGAIIANSDVPSMALNVTLPYLSAFAFGAVVASILPFVAYRHDAGLAAYSEACLQALDKAKEKLPEAVSEQAIGALALAFEEQGQQFNRTYVRATRALVILSALAFVFGLGAPLLGAAVGSNPLNEISSKKSDEAAVYAVY